MNQPQSTPSIVVGIDGSQAAINAARWAVIEASSRDLPLRLVHVIEQGAGSASAADPDIGVEYAETVLREAEAAVHSGTELVKSETAMVRGSAGSALIDESRYAAMVCVGSVGIGRCSSMLFGSTAIVLARGAHCPVAIVRAHHDALVARWGWVAVAVDDSPGNDALLEHAFREAELRNSPLLALEVQPWRHAVLLDRSVESWATRFPDVHIQLTPVHRGLTEFLTGTDEPIQLAVIGEADADSMTRIVGPVTHDAAEQAGCSVLVIRD